MDNTSTVANDAQKSSKPIAPKVNELIARSQSLIMATVNEEGVPTSSFAPFARIDNKFYILVSFMARHTKNLINGKPVSIMFIEDESATKQIYARERLTFDVATTQIDRDTDAWNLAVEKLQDKHGKILEVLTGMNDFILVELAPVKGSYVNGFGSAYFVDEHLEIINH